MTRVAPYGTWPSPISAASLVEGAVGVSELVTDGDDIWWSESRPDQGGRIAIVRRRGDDVQEITGPNANVRTRVHEYGGGAWWVDSGILYYVELADQRLRKLQPGSDPVLLTPEPPEPAAWRYADGRVSVDGRWFVCVREVHHQVPGGGAYLEPDNQLVAVATDGSMEVRELVLGADFYSSPRPSPDGSLLAWVQWDHPNMPWDGTELWVGELEDGDVLRGRQVTGGPAVSISQPEWSPDSELYFLSDRTGRSNLYLLAHDGAEAEVAGDFDIAGLAIVFGGSRYAIAADGSLIVAMSRPKGDVMLIDAVSTVESGWSSITAVRSLGNGGAAYIGATHSSVPTAIVHVDEPLFAGTPHVHGVSEAFLAPPEAITFPTTGDTTAHALFYRPAHDQFEGPDNEAPPLLVLAHGGPTDAAKRRLNLELRYWTSRGWAVVDVDYRGSVGYGRDYMRSLDGQWGVADVDDCIAAARFLVERGDVDGERLAIRGGSAGGFTVLAALTFHDVFAAGASRYGIADLEALVRDTHKFESRYLDGLIGAYPDEIDKYVARSPIHHTHLLSAPMIVLQGADDKVVLPNQAEMMVDALADKGITHAYLLFEGEGHGFRQGANIVAALESEFSFFAQIFGFEPADGIPAVQLR